MSFETMIQHRVGGDGGLGFGFFPQLDKFASDLLRRNVFPFHEYFN
jgi:hypothetical protein